VITIEARLASMDDIENGPGNIYGMDAAFLEAMRGGGPPP
jgi:hypothetical protein